MLAFNVVVDSLEHLQNNYDDKAELFKAAILRFDFIIGLVVCQHFLNDDFRFKIQNVICYLQ